MNDIEMNIKMRKILTYNNTYVYKKYYALYTFDK